MQLVRDSMPFSTVVVPNLRLYKTDSLFQTNCNFGGTITKKITDSYFYFRLTAVFSVEFLVELKNLGGEYNIICMGFAHLFRQSSTEFKNNFKFVAYT